MKLASYRNLVTPINLTATICRQFLRSQTF